MRELPTSWAWTTIDEIASTSSGGTPSRTRLDYYGGSIPWVKSGELNDGLVSEVSETITENGLKNSSAKIFPSGTLCIALYGATVGKVGILALDAATNQAVCGITPRAQIEAKYLFYFFQSQRSTLIGLSQGGAQPNISQQIVRSTAIPVCSRSEQDRIIDEIEKQFTRLDAATAALKRVQANLKRYRASVLKAACEGRLVPTEAELARKEGRDYEPADKLLQRILRERRARWEADTLGKMQASGKPPKDNHWKQKYKEPSAPDTSNLPTLPEGWCWASLGQIVWSVKDGPHYSPKYVESGIPFITGGQVRPSGVDFNSAKFISPELHEELSRRCRPEKGDVLLTKGGTTGIARVNTYDIDFSVWVHVAVLKPVDSIEPFYLQHALNSPFCYAQSMRYTHGVGNQDLGLTRMVNIVMALPPLVEQNRINGELDRQFATIDRLEANMDAGTAHWRRLRQSILSSAFTGQLVPQDPTDEPASVLLERIRAGRVESSKKNAARKTVRKRGQR